MPHSRPPHSRPPHSRPPDSDSHTPTSGRAYDPDAVIPYLKREMYAEMRPVQRAFLAALRIWAVSGRIPTIGQIQVDADLVEMRRRGVRRLPPEDECRHYEARRARSRLICRVRARPDDIPEEGPESTVGPLA